jgi:hypothetical protein
VYFFSASRWPSASALSTFWPPRTGVDRRFERLAVGAELLEERAERGLRLGGGEDEQLARDELVAALARLLLGRLQHGAELAPG